MQFKVAMYEIVKRAREPLYDNEITYYAWDFTTEMASLQIRNSLFRKSKRFITTGRNTGSASLLFQKENNV
jgi:hypothetical protein